MRTKAELELVYITKRDMSFISILNLTNDGKILVDY